MITFGLLSTHTHTLILIVCVYLFPGSGLYCSPNVANFSFNVFLLILKFEFFYCDFFVASFYSIGGYFWDGTTQDYPSSHSLTTFYYLYTEEIIYCAVGISSGFCVLLEGSLL